MLNKFKNVIEAQKFNPTDRNQGQLPEKDNTLVEPWKMSKN